jgi:phosphoribosylformylglycinamidine synthase subunit PurL
VDCNARYVYLHPYEGAKAVVAEAARNLSCVGAEPVAVTDNLNFGSPEKPIGYWQLAEACRGLSEGCLELATPVTGGNVSLYNETMDSNGQPQPIYPTPVIGMVGIISDLDKICGQSWTVSGQLIYLLGATSQPTLGASEYLATIHKTVAGRPPAIDFDQERKVQAACRYGIRQGWVKAAHDSSEGGIAVALAESCIGQGLGATIKLPQLGLRADEEFFGESGARIVVAIDPTHRTTWEIYLQENLANDWLELGVVGGDRLQITTTNGTIDLSLPEMTKSWSEALERRLA